LRHSNTYVRFSNLLWSKLALIPRCVSGPATLCSVSRRSRHYGDQRAKVVQALLGHSSQQVTTEIYTHISPEEFENAERQAGRDL
jgi:integrase